MTRDDSDETRLIDVSDVEQEMAEEFTQEATLVANEDEVSSTEYSDEFSGSATRIMQNQQKPASLEKIIPPSAPDSGTTSRVATITERFVATIIDGLVLCWLYWGGVQIYYLIREGNWGGLAPTNLHLDGLAFHGAFFVAAFLYFFVFEGVFGFTIGKLCCSMRIRRTNGKVASLTAIFLRNLFRPLDLIGGGLVALLCMEFSAKQQRFGDLAAGTIVVTTPPRGQLTSVTWDMMAGSIGRILSGIINITLAVILFAATMLLLDDTRHFYSHWVLLIAPPVALGLWSFALALGQCSPGHWLFGYNVVRENGAPISFPLAWVRSLTYWIDLLGVGLLAVILSPRHQRFGDMITGTLVIRSKRTMKGLIASLLVIGATIGIAYFAFTFPRQNLANQQAELNNPATWLNQDFQWNFVPRTELWPNFPPVSGTPEPFRIHGFHFAEGSPEDTRQPAVFVPGETAFLVFELSGFATEDQEVWVQEDLSIRYPDNTFGLKQENIIDHHQVKRIPGPLVLRNNVNLPEGIPEGKYTVYITVRDKLAGGAPVIHTEYFYIKAKK